MSGRTLQNKTLESQNWVNILESMGIKGIEVENLVFLRRADDTFYVKV